MQAGDTNTDAIQLNRSGVEASCGAIVRGFAPVLVAVLQKCGNWRPYLKADHTDNGLCF